MAPREDPVEQDSRINVRAGSELVARAQKAAELAGMSYGEFVRTAVERAIDELIDREDEPVSAKIERIMGQAERLIRQARRYAGQEQSK